MDFSQRATQKPYFIGRIHITHCSSFLCVFVSWGSNGECEASLLQYMYATRLDLIRDQTGIDQGYLGIGDCQHNGSPIYWIAWQSFLDWRYVEISIMLCIICLASEVISARSQNLSAFIACRLSCQLQCAG